MLDEIAVAIDAVRDPKARPRLRQCLPAAEAVVAQWHRQGALPSMKLNVIVATPVNGVLVHGDDWPDPTGSKLKRDEGISAVVHALEGDSDGGADVIIGGLAVMLGGKGIRAQREDAELIAEDHGVPLVVALVERVGRSITVLVTTIAAPAGIDDATIH